jgi:hypothetical protein
MDSDPEVARHINLPWDRRQKLPEPASGASCAKIRFESVGLDRIVADIHDDTTAHGSEDCRVFLRADPFRDRQSLTQARQLNAIPHQRRGNDRSQAGDVLMVDLAGKPSGLDQVDSEPMPRL